MYTCIIYTPPHTPQSRTAHYTLRLGGRPGGQSGISFVVRFRIIGQSMREKAATSEAKSSPSYYPTYEMPCISTLEHRIELCTYVEISVELLMEEQGFFNQLL